MSKELEALENIKHYDSRVGLHESDYDIIEKALKNEDKEKFELIKQVRELKDENASLKSFNSKLWIERQDNEKQLKALEIIKSCLVSEFKLFEKDGEYLILFYFDEEHELTFRLKNKEEYDLLKEVLL